MNAPHIKVIKRGPYLVTGRVRLKATTIVKVSQHYEYRALKTYEIEEDAYYLCRCGQSKDKPFCDGSHKEADFIGNETASKMPYRERADQFQGPTLTLLDDNRCALSRLCHREDGKVWKLLEHSDSDAVKEELVKGVHQCPSGRLFLLDADGQALEEAYDPVIEIITNASNDLAGPIYVKGGITLEADDGSLYERQNRYALCRCGKSVMKPFCNASHEDLLK